MDSKNLPYIKGIIPEENVEIFMNDHIFRTPGKVEIDPAFLARLAKMGGDHLVVELTHMYFARSVELIDNIVSGLLNSEFEPIKNASHSLISSAGNLGGQRVSDLSKLIEQAALDRDLETLRALEPELLEAQSAFIAYLEKDLESR